MDHPLEIVMIQNGGLAWHGGLIARQQLSLSGLSEKGAAVSDDA